MRPVDTRGFPKRPTKLPDLDRLTEAQKDDLIRGLWDTLVAIDRDGAQALETVPDAVSPQRRSAETASADRSATLRQRIRTTRPSKRAQERVTPSSRLGFGFGFLDSRAFQVVLLVVGLGFLADFGIGWYQREALAGRERIKLALRNAAFAGLFVELRRVSYEPDTTSYRATMIMQPLNEGTPLYVMIGPVRIFVQKGLVWRELPSQAVGGKIGSVVKLQGAEDYAATFRVDDDDWSQLIPGYMHILIESGMLISRSPEPQDDIVERPNRFYVYLKPQNADDDAIKRRSNFRGTPPIFIPMPPH